MDGVADPIVVGHAFSKTKADFGDGLNVTPNCASSPI
jgi:hypothetical protein